MDFKQIETQLRALFPETHGEDFQKIGVLFAMLNGCQPAKLQRATGYAPSLIAQVVEDVQTHAPFAIYSGAMAPRHLWIEYPQTRELIEAITGQKLVTTPVPAPTPKPTRSNTMQVCGYDNCTRPAGHSGRHYRKSDTTAQKPRQSAAAPVSNPEPVTALTTVPTALPDPEPPAKPALLPGLPDVQVRGRFKFKFTPEQTGQDDLYIVMGGRATISRNRALAFMGDAIDGEQS